MLALDLSRMICETRNTSRTIPRTRGAIAQVFRLEASSVKYRETRPLGLSTIRSRRDDQQDGNGHKYKRDKVQSLFPGKERSLEAGVEHGDELKAEQRLDTGQYHTGFLDHVMGFLFQGLAFHFFLVHLFPLCESA
jgi:hypothetical protein